MSGGMGLRAARWIAAGLGSGWLPKAPGTWGSLAGLPLAWLLVETGGAAALFAAAGLLVGIGCAACAVILPHLDEDDPAWIVIDEWGGQWLAVAVIASFFNINAFNMALAFVAFRLLDIYKPFPIRHCEHWGPAWWSIMADDMAAGVMAGALALIILFCGRIWL